MDSPMSPPRDPAASLEMLQSGISVLAEEVRRMRASGADESNSGADSSGVAAEDVAREREQQVRASKLAALLMARPAGGISSGTKVGHCRDDHICRHFLPFPD